MNSTRLDRLVLLVTAVLAGSAEAGRYPPVNGRGNVVNGRGQTVNGRGTPLNGRGTPVNGRGVIVNGRGPAVNGRGTPLNGMDPTTGYGDMVYLVDPGMSNWLATHAWTTANFNSFLSTYASIACTNVGAGALINHVTHTLSVTGHSTGMLINFPTACPAGSEARATPGFEVYTVPAQTTGIFPGIASNAMSAALKKYMMMVSILQINNVTTTNIYPYSRGVVANPITWAGFDQTTAAYRATMDDPQGIAPVPLPLFGDGETPVPDADTWIPLNSFRVSGGGGTFALNVAGGGNNLRFKVCLSANQSCYDQSIYYKTMIYSTTALATGVGTTNTSVALTDGVYSVLVANSTGTVDTGNVVRNQAYNGSLTLNITKTAGAGSASKIASDIVNNPELVTFIEGSDDLTSPLNYVNCSVTGFRLASNGRMTFNLGGSGCSGLQGSGYNAQPGTLLHPRIKVALSDPEFNGLMGVLGGGAPAAVAAALNRASLTYFVNGAEVFGKYATPLPNPASAYCLSQELPSPAVPRARGYGQCAAEGAVRVDALMAQLPSVCVPFGYNGLLSLDDRARGTSNYANCSPFVPMPGQPYPDFLTTTNLPTPWMVQLVPPSWSGYVPTASSTYPGSSPSRATNQRPSFPAQAAEYIPPTGSWEELADERNGFDFSNNDSAGYLMVDLGALRWINLIKLWPRTDSWGWVSTGTLNIHEVQLSNDGVTWHTTSDGEFDSAAFAALGAAPIFHTFRDAVQARYIRVHDWGLSYVQLAEIEAYGTFVANGISGYPSNPRLTTYENDWNYLSTGSSATSPWSTGTLPAGTYTFKVIPYSGDTDLYIKVGGAVSRSSYDYASLAGGTTVDQVTVTLTSPNYLIIMAYGYVGGYYHFRGGETLAYPGSYYVNP